MKKILYSICAIGIAFASCKKDISPDEPPVASDKKVAVEFSVTDFLRKQEDLPTPGGRKSKTAQGRDTLLHEKVSHIYYYAFKKTADTLASSQLQTPATFGNEFGIVKDSLVPGSYTIIIVAATDSLIMINDGPVFGTPFELASHRAYYPETNGYFNTLSDQFYKKFDIVVPATGIIPQSNVSLDRYISKLEVRLNDAETIEASNKDIQVTAKGANLIFLYNAGSTMGSGQGSFLLNKVSPTVFTSLVLPLDNSFYEVKVEVKERGTGAVLSTRTINNVMAQKNKATILRGNALPTPTSDGTAEWHLSLNNIWDASGPVIDY